MLLEYRFNKVIEKLAAEARVPLRMKLWNGRSVALAPEPMVTIEIPHVSALRFFVPPDICLAGCAYAFTDGWINVYQALACKAGPSTAKPLRLPLTRDYMYA